MPNDQLTTDLLKFAKLGKKDAADATVKCGANVNGRDNFGHTPLQWAVRHDQADLARLLIARGAQVNCMDLDNQTPLHWSARFGCTKAAKLLIEHGADLNAKDITKQTPLKLAHQHGHEEVATILTEAMKQVVGHTDRIYNQRGARPQDENGHRLR